MSELIEAAASGNVDKVRALLRQGKYSVECCDSIRGATPLHHACRKGYLDIVRVLVSEFNADLTLRDAFGISPLHFACEEGHLNVVRALASEFKADVSLMDITGQTPLHFACDKGHVDVARVLVSEFKADVSLRNITGQTPLHYACEKGHVDVARVLISEFKADVSVKDTNCRTPLHYACENGNLIVARVLVFEFKADLLDAFNFTPLMAIRNGHIAVLCNLFQGSPVSIQKAIWANIQNDMGQALLHYTWEIGDVDLLLALIRDHGADSNICNKVGDTPLHIAARANQTTMAVFLCDSGCDPNKQNRDGQTPFHCACERGNLDLVRAFILDHKADVNVCDNKNNSPLHIAVQKSQAEVVKALSKSGCDPNMQNENGLTPLHYACKQGDLYLVQTLVQDHKADVNACEEQGDTPLHIAAREGKTEVVLALRQSGCDPNMQNKYGQAPLHYACKRGDLDLVRALVSDHKADVSLCNEQGNTALHEAAQRGQHDVVLTLVQEHDCDFSSQGHLGRTPLHMASLAGHHKTVQILLKFTSPLVTDEDGNTPLHLASATEPPHWNGKTLHPNKFLAGKPSVLLTIRCLLDANAPVLIRNNNGWTPKDLASGKSETLLEDHIRVYQQQILADYDELSRHAKKKYSGSNNITRVFVLGYSGAGKSTFVESLKREGLFQSFSKVSESSVPPHTAGIIPSTHKSSRYGRVQFYDFAGDAEYYSSHAAIFESLASSRKGDNFFIIVVDLRKSDITLKNTLHYWFAFVHYQKFSNASFLVVGSHLDQSAEQSDCLEEFCTMMCPKVRNVKHFMVDCRDPRSTQIAQVKKQIFEWVSESQKYELSSEARLLLGLLEKDFSAVTACPVQTLVSHIKDSGVWLPVEPNLLYQILLELHEVGILLLLGDCTKNSDHVVLNVAKLTNEVHELLFAKSAFASIKEVNTASFNIGILPEEILEKLLPPYITMKCLIHLQYCQKISHNDINVFSSLEQNKSGSQSFLFFPALCSVDKSQVSWDDSTGSFSIGWLALCTDPHDYFPPRFLHVLLLRLVYGFTLSSVRQKSHAFPEHSRRCTMWKNGVHWKMEEGVNCMVELLNGSKGLVVLTKSAMEREEDCARIFAKVVSCVMEAKAEFCQSTKPEFFLLDSSAEADHLNEDHQFAVSDVQKALESPEGRHVIISVSGRGEMELAKLDWMLNLTLWNSLFPFQLNQVLFALKVIVREIFDLGLRLDAPYEFLDSLRVNFPSDVDQRKTQLLRWWMKNSLKPPCWYTLVEALKDIERSSLAEEIRIKHNTQIQLQEKLLCEKFRAVKPNMKFLSSLSGVVGSRWPSLAVSLALTEEEIEATKGKVGFSHQELALQMLNIWASRGKATYGQLFHKLKTISLLYTSAHD